MAQPRNSQPRRARANLEAELQRLLEEESAAIGEIQGWCNLCQGSGMVMEFGPTDCPNLNLHRLIASIGQSQLMSKKEAARLIGVDIRSINRHMELGHIPHQSVGGHVLFERLDVLRFERAYWY